MPVVTAMLFGMAHVTDSGDWATGYCSVCGSLVYLDLDRNPVGATCPHLATSSDEVDTVSPESQEVISKPGD